MNRSKNIFSRRSRTTGSPMPISSRGEAGMGRKSLANAFALTLLCEKGMTDPCMECHACKQVLSGKPSGPDLCDP